MMTGFKVAVLQNTMARVQNENGGSQALGLRFYERLFEKYPAVKPLFHTPPEEQHKKLMASLGAIVAGANNLEKTLPYLRAMAIRHLKYGTEPAHYPAVSENLQAVLKEHLSVEGQWSQAEAHA
jgi:methyl-accepting chemotaxis protein